MGDTSKIHQAMEAFIHGLCACRNFTHPFLPERVGRLWVARDGPRKSGNYRNEEWAAFGVRPAEVDRIVQQHAKGKFAICAMHPVGESAESMRQEYKSLGYRNGAVRQYVALADNKIIGWVRSVSGGDSRWCSNMHVLPAFRRCGIARAMLSRMRRDDRESGAKANILTSSHVGAMLYPLLGHEHLATLYVYKLRRK